MEQADVRAILTEVRNLKTELKEFMSGHTTELEKQNLRSTRGSLFREIQGIARQAFSDRSSSGQDERGHAGRTEIIKDNNNHDSRHSDSGTTFDHGGSTDQDAHLTN